MKRPGSDKALRLFGRRPVLVQDVQYASGTLVGIAEPNMNGSEALPQVYGSNLSCHAADVAVSAQAKAGVPI